MKKGTGQLNRIHEKALRLAYKDNVSTFDQLLAKNNSVTTHKRNLQLLMTDIFKTKSKLNPDFMNDIFKDRSVSRTFRKDLTHFYRLSKQLQYSPKVLGHFVYF